MKTTAFTNFQVVCWFKKVGVHICTWLERVEKNTLTGGLSLSLSCSPCCAVLRPYKYAGYPMLIKTIQLETGDDELFSKSAPILTAASEVSVSLSLFLLLSLSLIPPLLPLLSALSFHFMTITIITVTFVKDTMCVPNVHSDWQCPLPARPLLHLQSTA